MNPLGNAIKNNQSEQNIKSRETNINLWLIRNGWSFYMLGEEVSTEHQEFLAAENEAREKQVGLWKAELQKD